MGDQISNDGLLKWIKAENLTWLAALIFAGGVTYSAIAQNSENIEQLSDRQEASIRSNQEINTKVEVMSNDLGHVKEDVQEIKQSQDRTEQMVQRILERLSSE